VASQGSIIRQQDWGVLGAFTDGVVVKCVVCRVRFPRVCQHDEQSEQRSRSLATRSRDRMGRRIDAFLPLSSMQQITRNSKRRARTVAPLKSSHGVRCSQGGNISNRLRVRVITGKAMWVMQMRETERWR